MNFFYQIEQSAISGADLPTVCGTPLLVYADGRIELLPGAVARELHHNGRVFLLERCEEEDLTPDGRTLLVRRQPVYLQSERLWCDGGSRVTP